MSNKANFSRRSFLKAVGAITVGSTAGSMLVPQASAKAATAFATDAESSIEIVKSSANFQSLLQQLQAQGFSTIDPSQLKFEGELEFAQTQGAQGMRIVSLNSPLGENVSSNANIGCVVDISRNELHTINCLVSKHVSLEELDVEQVVIFNPTNSWDKKSARLILPSSTLDDSIRTPDIRSLRSPAPSALSSTEPTPVQVVEADGFTAKQTTIRVHDLRELPESQVKALADIGNTSVGQLSSSPHASAVQASCATYSDYSDTGYVFNRLCGVKTCYCSGQAYLSQCFEYVRTQCLRYHYANCSVSAWNCWLSFQTVWDKCNGGRSPCN